MNFTTSIGSLPFKEPQAAVDFAFKFDLPFFPELPVLDSQELLLSRIERFYLTKDASQLCDSLFKEALLQKKTRKIKWQVVDPLTYFKYQTTNLSLEEIQKIIEDYISVRMDFFRSFYQGEICLFLDAPGIDFSPKNLTYLGHFLNSFKEKKIKTGLHACQTLNTDFNFKTPLFDYFSFDYLLNSKLSMEKLSELASNLIYGVYDYQHGPSAAKRPQMGPNDGISSVCGLAGAKVSDTLVFFEEINKLK